ncbi:hypothetical protein GCM10028895_18080 [Pontibacter rugosus]
MKNVEHIGIAVKNFSEANALYNKLLGVAPYKTEHVASEGVNTSFLKLAIPKLNCWKD